MTEELYIDNQLVDLTADSTITLNFKSNLLNDVSKITSSNSQTIKLPKTTHNRRIFDNATAPSYSSNFRYKRHTARYVRNGVAVISNAYAVLLDSSEDYEIALYWGVMANFQSWVDKGAKLEDLPTLSMTWSNTTPSLYPSYGNSFIVANYDCGLGDYYSLSDAAKALIAIHPTVRVSWLLAQIQVFAGVTFNIPSVILVKIQRLGVPMITRKSNTAPTVSCDFSGVRKVNDWSFSRYGGFVFTTEQTTSGFYTIQDGAVVDNVHKKSIPCKTIKPLVSGRVGIQLNFTVALGLSWSGYVGLVHIELVRMRGGQWSQDVSITTTSSHVGGDVYYFECSNVNGAISIDVEQGDELGIYVRMPYDGCGFYGAFNGSPITGWARFTVPAAEIDIALGDTFYSKTNMPDVTQIDFIKAICAMFGLFVVSDAANANNLKFVSLDNLLENRSSAVDWSDKLIDGGGNEPQTVKFKIGDYCRHNYFKYKEDATVAASGDGDLTIADESLEKEKTVLTLPFAASDGKKIPHYKWNDDQTAVESVNLQSRIMNIVSEADTSTGTLRRRCALSFNGLNFNTLLDTYNLTMKRMLNAAISINEQIRLTEIDLCSLDYTLPVYLRQYGKYYGIVSIQTSSDDVCDVELVQLPTDDSSSDGVFYSTDNGESYSDDMPTDYVRCKVATSGIDIYASQISTLAIAASANGARLDLTLAEYSDEYGGDVFAGMQNSIDEDANTWSLDNIRFILLPNDVTTIGSGCFNYAHNIERIILPPTLIEIQREGFYLCHNLAQIDMPATIERIGYRAFQNTNNLATIVCRANTPPTLGGDVSGYELLVFVNAGSAVVGDKYVYVPDVETYLANAGWADLQNTNGYTFRPLSEYVPSDDADNITVTLHKADNWWIGGGPAIDDTISASVVGAGQHEVGSIVTITADGGDQYAFAGWYDTASGTIISRSATYSFMATADVEFIATFEFTL